MPALVRPALTYMGSFVDALRVGCQRDTLRPGTPEAIAAIDADPAAFIANLENPPPTITLPDGRQVERIPETILWYVEEDEFLGSVGIRHALS